MDRFTRLFVGGVLALVGAGLVTAVAVRGRDTPPDLTTPGGVVLAYALALQNDQPQAAWDLLATPVQDRNDRDLFIAHARIDDDAALSTDNVQVTNGSSATVVLLRRHPAAGLFGGYDGYTNRDTVVLVREADNWRISVPPDPWLVNTRKPS
jgi:hypothetical protein